MTLDELFDIVTKIIAEPHSQILEHDKRRAIQIFLGFQEYVLDHWQGDDDENNACVNMSDLDFEGYVSKQLDILEGKVK
jgi:hypothetical protein